MCYAIKKDQSDMDLARIDLVAVLTVLVGVVVLIGWCSRGVSAGKVFCSIQ